MEDGGETSINFGFMTNFFPIFNIFLMVYFKYHSFDEKKYKRNYGRSNYLVKIKK